MTAETIDPSFVAKYAERRAPWGFSGLGEIVYLRTYSRFREDLGRKERWHETVERAVNGAQEIGAQYTQAEMQRLYDYIWNFKGSFSGRALWQLGTPLVQKFGGASLCACYYSNLETIDDYDFLMDHLMLGGGLGFSVERGKIHDFPKIKSDIVITHERTEDADFIVPDSRQGWRTLLHKVLKSYFYTGKSFTYSTILVRGYGAALKTFGGTASGPEILIEGINDICQILSRRTGKKMRSIDALDVANVIAKMVEAGSARRSAQIAVGDPDDFLFLRAKNWDSGTIPAYRSHSNNSIFADSWDEIADELWKGYNGSGEPYGLINRKLASTQGRLGEKVNDSKIVGPNPCGEILLEDGENCNLSEIFLPNVESKEELKDLSVLLYKMQKAVTSLYFPYEKTRKVMARNRRLGQGITGWMQATEEQISWVPDTYVNLKKFDAKWSAKLEISESIKLTCSKPSGTLSLLAGVTPGVNPAHSRFYIRRLRIGANDPIVDYCRQRGYPIQFDVGLDGTPDHRTVVVSFPCESPKNALLVKDTTAIDQLEWVTKVQTLWADNAVSVTVAYRKEELPEIQEWLKRNYETRIKSVSFLLHEGHGFALAPYEEISEDEYTKMAFKLKEATLGGSVLGDQSEDLLDVECSGGACPVR